MAVLLSVQGAEQLTELAVRLRKAGPDGKGLVKELRKAVRQAARPALVDVKKATRAIPIRGEKSAHGGGYSARAAHKPSKVHRGLRARVAMAEGVELRLSTRGASAKLRVNRKALPPDQQSLPRLLDKADGWWHPVFGGTRNVSLKKIEHRFLREHGGEHRRFVSPKSGTEYVRQFGKPYWYATLRKHGPKVRREVLHAMDVTARKIAKG